MKYGSIILDKHIKDNINNLEMQVSKVHDPEDYHRISMVTDMLHKLHWQTLQEKWRTQARTVMMYRIVHQIVTMTDTTDSSHYCHHIVGQWTEVLILYASQDNGV